MMRPLGLDLPIHRIPMCSPSAPMLKSTAVAVTEPRSLPPQPTEARIEEAKRHLRQAEASLLLIWPNRGETHIHAAEAFGGISKAMGALS